MKMNDEQILNKGGDERDIEEYAKQNGADFPTPAQKNLREKWNEFVKDTREYGEFPEVLVQHIEDFWFAHHNATLDELIGEVKEMRTKGIDKVPEVMETDRLYNIMNENMEIGYNQALEDVRTLLANKKI